MSTVPHADPAVKVDALTWATGITGKRWDVASAEQRQFAVELLNRDHLLGAKVVPIGPSLEELDALLAARGEPDAPKPAPTPKPRQEPARATWANAWKPSDAERAAMAAAVAKFDRTVDEAYARSYPAATVEVEASIPAEMVEPLAAFHSHIAAFDSAVAEYRQAEEELAALEDEPSDPATWPAWTDADRWELGPDPTEHDWSEYAAWSEGRLEQQDDAPATDLSGWIEAEARRYRSLRTQAGEMVADALVELAGSVRLTQARTPRQAIDRIEALEARHAALAGV